MSNSNSRDDCRGGIFNGFLSLRPPCNFQCFQLVAQSEAAVDVIFRLRPSCKFTEVVTLWDSEILLELLGLSVK